MAYFEWKPDIAVGHAQIDEQHRRLIALAEAVVDPLFSTAEHRPGEAPLQELIEFARQHFAFEEDLMRSAGYPEAAGHARFHASLLAELETYCARVTQGVNTNPVGFISFLWNWLVLHIDSADRQLVTWLAARDSENSG